MTVQPSLPSCLIQSAFRPSSHKHVHFEPSTNPTANESSDSVASRSETSPGCADLANCLRPLSPNSLQAITQAFTHANAPSTPDSIMSVTESRSVATWLNQRELNQEEFRPDAAKRVKCLSGKKNQPDRVPLPSLNLVKLQRERLNLRRLKGVCSASTLTTPSQVFSETTRPPYLQRLSDVALTPTSGPVSSTPCEPSIAGSSLPILQVPAFAQAQEHPFFPLTPKSTLPDLAVSPAFSPPLPSIASLFRGLNQPRQVDSALPLKESQDLSMNHQPVELPPLQATLTSDDRKKASKRFVFSEFPPSLFKIKNELLALDIVLAIYTHLCLGQKRDRQEWKRVLEIITLAFKRQNQKFHMSDPTVLSNHYSLNIDTHLNSRRAWDLLSETMQQKTHDFPFKKLSDRLLKEGESFTDLHVFYPLKGLVKSGASYETYKQKWGKNLLKQRLHAFLIEHYLEKYQNKSEKELFALFIERNLIELEKEASGLEIPDWVMNVEIDYEVAKAQARASSRLSTAAAAASF